MSTSGQPANAFLSARRSAQIRRETSRVRKRVRHSKGLSTKSLKTKESKKSIGSAHNLKVVGSNPTPATKIIRVSKRLRAALRGGVCVCAHRESTVEARGKEVLRAQAHRGKRRAAFSLLKGRDGAINFEPQPANLGLRHFWEFKAQGSGRAASARRGSITATARSADATPVPSPLLVGGRQRSWVSPRLMQKAIDPRGPRFLPCVFSGK